MKPNPTKKPRRPRPMKFLIEIDGIDEKFTLSVHGDENPAYFRKLAKWLVKAADWLEGRDEKISS